MFNDYLFNFHPTRIIRHTAQRTQNTHQCSMIIYLISTQLGSFTIQHNVHKTHTMFNDYLFNFHPTRTIHHTAQHTQNTHQCSMIIYLISTQLGSFTIQHNVHKTHTMFNDYLFNFHPTRTIHHTAQHTQNTHQCSSSTSFKIVKYILGKGHQRGYPSHHDKTSTLLIIL